MMEALKDWAEWLVGIPAIFVTVWIYWKQTSTKKLTAKIVSRPILNIKYEEIKKELKISYKDNLFDSIFLTSIHFENKGNAPIKKDDFEGNIIIENSDKSSEIISSNISYKYPENINIRLGESKFEQIEIMPGLLNSGDRFTVDILSDQELKVLVNSRIADTKFDVVEGKNQYSFMMLVGVIESHFYLFTLIVAILFYLGCTIPFFGILTITLLVLSATNLLRSIVGEWRTYRNVKK